MDLGTAQRRASAAEEAAALDYLVDPPEEGGEQEQAQEVHQDIAEGGALNDGSGQGGVPPVSSFHANLQAAQPAVVTSSVEIHAILPARGAKRQRAPAEKDEQARRIRPRARREEAGSFRARRMVDISPLPLRLLVRSAVYEDITVVVAQDANISQLKIAIEEQSNSRLRESFNPVLLLGNTPLSKDFLTLKQVGIIENDTVIGFLARDTRGLIETAGLQRFHELRDMVAAPSPLVGPSPTGELAARALVGMGRDAMRGYDNFVTPPPEAPPAPTRRPQSTKPKRQSKKVPGGLTLSSLNGPQLDPSQLPPGYCQVSAADLLMSSLAAARAASQRMAKRRASAPQSRVSVPAPKSAAPSQIAAPVQSTPMEADPIAVAPLEVVPPGRTSAEVAAEPSVAPVTVPAPAETPQASDAPVPQTHSIVSNAAAPEKQAGPTLSSLLVDANPDGANPELEPEGDAQDATATPLPPAVPLTQSTANPHSTAQDMPVHQSVPEPSPTPPEPVEAPSLDRAASNPRTSPLEPSELPDAVPPSSAGENTAVPPSNEVAAASPSLVAEASDLSRQASAPGAEPSSDQLRAEAIPTQPPSSEPLAAPPPAGTALLPLIADGDDDWEARARAAATRGNNPAPVDDTPGAFEMVRPERPVDSFLGRDDGDWDKAAQQMALQGNQWMRIEGTNTSRYVAMRLASAGPFPTETITVASSLPPNPTSETPTELAPAGSPIQNSQLPFSTPDHGHNQTLGDQTQGQSPGEVVQPLYDASGSGQEYETPGSEGGLTELVSEGALVVAGEMQQSEQQWQLAVRQDKAFRQKHPTGEQRRARRLFTVGEVEALITAVERLGTGRWRDVKQRAFPLAKHRTYADLKDKWKTLVRTAQIAPSQRRGIEVPEELLERVTRAHSFWRRQAEFDERYAAQYPSEHMGLPFAESALPPYPGQDPPPPIMEEIRGGTGEARSGEDHRVHVSSPGAGQTQPVRTPGDPLGSHERGELVSGTNMGPLELGYVQQMVGNGVWEVHHDLQRQGGEEEILEECTATGSAGAQPSEHGEQRQVSREALRGEATDSQIRNAGSSGSEHRINSNDLGAGLHTRPYVPSSGVESLRAAYDRQVSAAGEDYRPASATAYASQTESTTYTHNTASQESGKFQFELARFQNAQALPADDEVHADNGVYSTNYGVVQGESIYVRQAQS